MAAGGDGWRGPPSHGGRQMGLAAHGAATLSEGVPFNVVHAYFTHTEKKTLQNTKAHQPGFHGLGRIKRRRTDKLTKTGHIRAPAAGFRVNGQPGPKDRAEAKLRAPNTKRTTCPLVVPLQE